ncbi:unnamed protein product [Prorocentrum cordatum]|uniref:Uncharacterized protein n=1 Tax=Prorocentrum cordatum TaxID=2364126 RepID=A0ABN9QDD0_9DINO|nr:unnamed protein product [Polarella glacialis]
MAQWQDPGDHWGDRWQAPEHWRPPADTGGTGWSRPEPEAEDDHVRQELADALELQKSAELASTQAAVELLQMRDLATQEQILSQSHSTLTAELKTLRAQAEQFDPRRIWRTRSFGAPRSRTRPGRSRRRRPGGRSFPSE